MIVPRGQGNEQPLVLAAPGEREKLSIDLQARKKWVKLAQT